MAENASLAAAAANSNSDASRGVPYYEKLRRDLRETLARKRQIDQALAALDDQIYKFETSYLEETSAGNIIKGFDNYIKGSAGISGGATGGGSSARRKATISDADRIFSRSSASFMRDSSTAPSAGTTPSHAPTPTSTFASARESNHPTPGSSSTTSKATSSKKKKAAAMADKDDEDTDSKPAKRGKITYGRE